MTQMVSIEKEDLTTTSEILAQGVNYEHRTVLKLIRDHEKDISEFGIIALGVRKSKRGKPTKYYKLNESQTYFLMTLMQNNESVTKFKKELVREFIRMRKALFNLTVEKQSDHWQQLRKSGKATRLDTTDTIKDFVEYAVKQGSKNAVMYYSNITKMENKALFILEQKFPNVREMLNGQQLATLRVADKMVMDTLQEGMECNTPYKEIYQLAKQRLSDFTKLVKPSIVISSTSVKVIAN